MEVQCCKVVPTEDSVDIYPSSQWMDVSQLAAATVLGIPSNQSVIYSKICILFNLIYQKGREGSAMLKQKRL